MELIERYRGSLLGLAAGDALGTAVEFKPPGSFPPVTGITGGGAFRLKAGEWTDDTSMALCLAESLIERQGFDPMDQLERYCRWYREGYLSSNGKFFDIGTATRRALELFERTRDGRIGLKFPDAAGNGSIMRLAPVALFYAERPAEALAKAEESSYTTHGSVEASDACRYLAALLTGALRGGSKEELLSDHYEPSAGLWAAQPLTPRIAAVAAGSFKDRDPPDISGGGYVVASLEAALWAFHRGSDFKEGALRAINLGDDADTTGAVFGQLAGAFYGEGGIPPEWREVIANRELILSLAEKLFALRHSVSDG